MRVRLYHDVVRGNNELEVYISDGDLEVLSADHRANSLFAQMDHTIIRVFREPKVESDEDSG